MSSLLQKYLTDAAYLCTLLPYIQYHKRVTHKYGAAVEEKFGHVPARAGDRPCLLLHAVSVGEAIAARPIIDAFAARFPAWDIRISVSTATGREVAAQRYGADRVCFYPLDLSRWTERFFDRVRPNLIVLMELEVWPNFLHTAEARGVPVLVANARITEKSTRQYKNASWLPPVKRMLNQPRLWLAQSEEYAARLREIGVEAARIRVSRSVKYDVVPTEPDPALRTRYRRILGADENTPVLVAGSTHPGEEETVLEAYSRLLADFPAARLVLAPRHPHRMEEVQGLCTAQGLPHARRSAHSEDAPAAARIVLLDTMGELASIYAAADAVFIGGTFIQHGGQNMLEPCGLGRPTVIGGSFHNFREAVEVLQAAGGIRILKDRNGLYPALREILHAPQTAMEMAERGRQALIAQKGATAATIGFIEEILREDGKWA